MTPDNSLRLVKLLHTVVWCFFVICIIAIPIAAFVGRFDLAFGFTAIVLVEVLVLLLNGFKCPLTDIAARYTDDRRDNFDIYLPVWIARHNKLIFGALFLAGTVYAHVRWGGWLI
jgi:hypothetical protein